MTESHARFLHQIVSCLPQSENNESLKLLRSFYLMRCKESVIKCGLPIKPFSSQVRCSKCCLEWDKKTNVEVKPIKLSTRQRQRLKKIPSNNEKKGNLRKSFLHSNQLEQTCSFCKSTTVTTLPKPDKQYLKRDKTDIPLTKTATSQHKTKKQIQETNRNKNQSKLNKKNKVEASKKTTFMNNTNVYSNAFDVFSLNNEKNTLASTVKEPAKIIKNNKKKKDKFAGLCQKAVMASAKIKQERQEITQNKLSLFLKPSG